MNRHTFLASVLALACTQALAQSSVTLSGVADLAARSVSNEGLSSVKSLVSGSNATSRLLFRGREDLGGGLSASFHLEAGFLLDAGAAAATNFFDRRATVSLVSASAGELRMGRDYVPSYLGWSRFDAFGYIGVAGSTNLINATPNGPIRSAFGSNPNTTVRASNTIQYFLPGGLGGFEGHLLVAAGEGATLANGGNKTMGARLGWSGGTVGVSVAHTKTENPQTATGKFTDTAAGASVDFGLLKLNLAVREFKQAQAKQTVKMISSTVPVGGAGEIRLSVVDANLAGRVGATNIDANDARQIGLGYVHNLSRRTALYATWSRIDNEGAATYAVPGGAAGLAGGRQSSGYELGLRHNF